MDPRASLSIKLMFLAAIGYVVWPLDLIPDVPIFGWFDDIGLFGIASAFLLSAIRPYRTDKAIGVEPGAQQHEVRAQPAQHQSTPSGQAQREAQPHDAQPQHTHAHDAQPHTAQRVERPIVTEVWSGRAPKGGHFDHLRGPNYLVETEGSDKT